MQNREVADGEHDCACRIFETSPWGMTTGRQEGATAEKAVPSSVLLFDGKPLRRAPKGGS